LNIFFAVKFSLRKLNSDKEVNESKARYSKIFLEVFSLEGFILMNQLEWEKKLSFIFRIVF
jgi:hypothetical protein